MPSYHRNALLQELHSYSQRWPEEHHTAELFAHFVANEEGCFHRSTPEGHITGSAFVVDPTGTQTLLTHHRKLNKWLQLGGHADGDPVPARVALTEAREESGMVEIDHLMTSFFDIDIHVIPARPNEQEHLHYDLRYVLRSATTTFRVSHESHALLWVPIIELSSYTTEPSMLRMAQKWQTLSSAFLSQ